MFDRLQSRLCRKSNIYYLANLKNKTPARKRRGFVLCRISYNTSTVLFMENQGSITVYTGPMFSGKSKALIARLETKERAHKRVLIVKPIIDNRFGMNEVV